MFVQKRRVKVNGKPQPAQKELPSPKKFSLRQAINSKCRSCVFDDANVGSWLVQVTLCSCKSCPLYEVRPVTKSPIAEGTLKEYGVTGAELAFYRQLDPREGHLSEKTPAIGTLVGAA